LSGVATKTMCWAVEEIACDRPSHAAAQQRRWAEQVSGLGGIVSLACDRD
jgi:hypothetical protein